MKQQDKIGKKEEKFLDKYSKHVNSPSKLSKQDAEVKAEAKADVEADADDYSESFASQAM